MIKKCIEYTITEPYTNRTVEEFLKSRGYSHRLVVYCLLYTSDAADE